MGPRPTQPENGDLFRPPLQEQLNPQHPLIVMAERLDWARVEALGRSLFRSHTGRPANPPRLMAGLLYLQQVFVLSNEDVVAMWVENPYWQVFCGESYLQIEPPIDPSSLTRWRQRLGERGMAKLSALMQAAADHSPQLAAVTLRAAPMLRGEAQPAPQTGLKAAPVLEALLAPSAGTDKPAASPGGTGEPAAPVATLAATAQAGVGSEPRAAEGAGGDDEGARGVMGVMGCPRCNPMAGAAAAGLQAGSAGGGDGRGAGNATLGRAGSARAAANAPKKTATKASKKTAARRKTRGKASGEVESLLLFEFIDANNPQGGLF